MRVLVAAGLPGAWAAPAIAPPVPALLRVYAGELYGLTPVVSSATLGSTPPEVPLPRPEVGGGKVAV